MGSPETVCVSHKAMALCYNTVSSLPVRLIRAPVLKPRPRSRAGMSAANTCFTHSPTIPGRFGGATCMRPVPVCHTVTFFFVYAVPSFVGEAYMPPGRGLPSRKVCGKLPALQYKAYTMRTINGWHRHRFGGRHVCRPYAWTKRRRSQKTVLRGKRGGTHACGPHQPRFTTDDPYRGNTAQFAAGSAPAGAVPSFFLFLFPGFSPVDNGR